MTAESLETAPAVATDDKLRLEQLGLALRNLKPHPYLMPIFGLVVCIIFSRWISLRVAVIWWAAFAASLLPLAIVSRRFLGKEPPPAEVNRWTVLISASYALSTLVWSSQAIFLWAP